MNMESLTEPGRGAELRKNLLALLGAEAPGAAIQAPDHRAKEIAELREEIVSLNNWLQASRENEEHLDAKLTEIAEITGYVLGSGNLVMHVRRAVAPRTVAPIKALIPVECAATMPTLDTAILPDGHIGHIGHPEELASEIAEPGDHVQLVENPAADPDENKDYLPGPGVHGIRKDSTGPGWVVFVRATGEAIGSVWGLLREAKLEAKRRNDIGSPIPGATVVPAPAPDPIIPITQEQYSAALERVLAGEWQMGDGPILFGGKREQTALQARYQMGSLDIGPVEARQQIVQNGLPTEGGWQEQALVSTEAMALGAAAFHKVRNAEMAAAFENTVPSLAIDIEAPPVDDADDFGDLGAA